MEGPAISSFDVLLIEDDAAAVRLTREALADIDPAIRLHVARDGVEGLDFLRRTGGFADAVRPDLILLDLNLPRRSGREVLAETKADPDLRRIPIVVLSASNARADVLACYDEHANSYVTKPLGFEDFLKTIRGIRDYWLGLVTLAE